MVKDKHDGMELRDDIDLKGKDITDTTGGGTVDGVDIGEGAIAIQKDNEGIWDADKDEYDATEYSTSSNTNALLKRWSYAAEAHKKHLHYLVDVQAKIQSAGKGYVTIRIRSPLATIFVKEVEITTEVYAPIDIYLEGWAEINKATKVDIEGRVDDTNTIYVKESSSYGKTVKPIEKCVSGVGM